jgi:hypothetical protein
MDRTGTKASWTVQATENVEHHKTEAILLGLARTERDRGWTRTAAETTTCERVAARGAVRRGRPTWRPLRRGVAAGASEAAAAAAGNTFDLRFTEAARSVVAEQLLERRGDAVKKGVDS